MTTTPIYDTDGLTVLQGDVLEQMRAAANIPHAFVKHPACNTCAACGLHEEAHTVTVGGQRKLL